MPGESGEDTPGVQCPHGQNCWARQVELCCFFLVIGLGYTDPGFLLREYHPGINLGVWDGHCHPDRVLADALTLQCAPES